MRPALLLLLLAVGCREARAPQRQQAAAHWQTARAALEANRPLEAYAAASVAASLEALGEHAFELLLTRATLAAEGELPTAARDRAALAYELGVLLDRPGVAAGESATLLTARARLALAGGDAAAARDALNAARRAAPLHSLSTRALAALDLAEGHDAEALALLEKVVAAGDLGVEASIAYATALLRTGAVERAAQFLVGATTLHADPALGELLADAAERLGRGDFALAQLERLASRGASAGLHVRLGELYLSFGRLDEAERALRTALASGPDLDASLLLARVALGRGDAPRARAAVERHLEVLPARPRALYTAAWVLAQTGDDATARALAAQFGQLAQRDAALSARAQQLADLFKGPPRP
jgi:tetratricopeptide (TPR) repeat protein